MGILSTLSGFGPIGVALALLAPAIVGPAAAAGPSLKLETPIFAELYGKAIAAKETEVVYYTAARTEEAKRLSDVWAANFPAIRLKIVGKKAPDLITQIEAERAAGQNRADVVTHTQPYVASLWKERGFYQPYKVSSFADLAPNYADPDGAFYSSGVYLLPAAYNTRTFSTRADLPKSLPDFLDPKWKGKIVLADPATAGNNRTFFLGLLQAGTIDWAYLEKLARQEILFVRGNAEVVRALATGERVLTPTISSFNILNGKEKGQAVEFYGLDDGTVVAEQPSGILAAAPHPQAAKLLLEILTTAQGQELVAGEGQYWPTNPRAGAIDGLPALADFRPRKLALASLSDEDEAQRFLKRFNQIFGRD